MKCFPLPWTPERLPLGYVGRWSLIKWDDDPDNDDYVLDLYVDVAGVERFVHSICRPSRDVAAREALCWVWAQQECHVTGAPP